MQRLIWVHCTQTKDWFHLWNSMLMSPEIQNRGISGPKKETKIYMSPPNFLTRVTFPYRGNYVILYQFFLKKVCQQNVFKLEIEIHYGQYGNILCWSPFWSLSGIKMVFGFGHSFSFSHSHFVKQAQFIYVKHIQKVKSALHLLLYYIVL